MRFARPLTDEEIAALPAGIILDPKSLIRGPEIPGFYRDSCRIVPTGAPCATDGGPLVTVMGRPEGSGPEPIYANCHGD